MKSIVTIALFLAVAPALAATQASDGGSISSVVVNGGADTANPGVTCIRVTTPVSALCTNNLLAIPNNNKQLVAAALLSKSTGSMVWVYYDDASPSHCPGQAFTPCSVISIESK
jgi:hypothetical protein